MLAIMSGVVLFGAMAFVAWAGNKLETHNIKKYGEEYYKELMKPKKRG